MRWKSLNWFFCIYPFKDFVQDTFLKIMNRPDLFLCGGESFTDVLVRRIAPALEKLAEATPVIKKMAETFAEDGPPQKRNRVAQEDLTEREQMVTQIGRLKILLAQETDKLESIKVVADNSIFTTVCARFGCASVHEDDEGEEPRDLTLDGWGKCSDKNGHGCCGQWVCGVHETHTCE